MRYQSGTTGTARGGPACLPKSIGRWLDRGAVAWCRFRVGRRPVLEWGHVVDCGHRRHRPTASRDDALECRRGARCLARSRYACSAKGGLPGALPCSRWGRCKFGMRLLGERASPCRLRAAPARRARAARRVVPRRRSAECCGGSARRGGRYRPASSAACPGHGAGRRCGPAVDRAHVPRSARERSLRSRRSTSPGDARRSRSVGSGGRACRHAG
jgi:hypothetical protein